MIDNPIIERLKDLSMISFRDIAEAVAEIFGVEDIFAKSQVSTLVNIRYSFWINMHKFGLTDEFIGEFCGYDRSTVCSGRSMAKRYIAIEDNFFQQIHKKVSDIFEKF